MKTDWQIGDRIRNRWEIHNILSGGMGRVYLVYDHEFTESFAIKTIREELFQGEPTVIERFRRESLAWISLELHQNITQARFFEVIDHRPFLFLELVSGGDLGQLIGKRQLVENLPRVLSLAIQFCDGMMHALSRGLAVHRDIKPSNCLLTEDGTLKVTDFGLAKVQDDASDPEEQMRNYERSRLGHLFGRFRRPASAQTKGADSTYESSVAMTELGDGVGTAPYMAPEQFANARYVDTRADIYSFGVMLFEMATGSLPFQATTRLDYKQQHKSRSPRLDLVDNENLRAIIEKCLFKEPAKRFQIFADVRSSLDEAYENETGARSPIAATGSALSSIDWVNKGFGLDNLGKTHEAIQCYERAIELNPENAVAWNNKGFALVRLNNFDSVLNCFERATTLDPKFERAWINRGLALRRLNRVDEAISCYDLVIAINQSNAEAWNNKGAAFVMLLRNEEALGCFDRAIGFDPNRLEFRVNRFRTLAVLGRWSEALLWLERQDGLESEFVDLFDSLARPFVPEPALTEFERRLAEVRRTKVRLQTQDDEAAISWNQRGIAASSRRQFEEAVKYYDRALAIDPSMVDALNNKGIALREAGFPEDALACHERVIELNPQYSDGWNDKGSALSDLGRPMEALACYDRALTMDHMHAKAWYNKGNVLFDLGLNQESLGCYERSLKISPKNASAWYNRGLLLLQQRKIREAAKCFDETLKIEPGHRKARMNRDMLGR